MGCAPSKPTVEVVEKLKIEKVVEVVKIKEECCCGVHHCLTCGLCKEVAKGEEKIAGLLKKEAACCAAG